MGRISLTAVLAAVLVTGIAACSSDSGDGSVESYTWAVVNDDADWGKRAGLRAAEMDGSLYVMGGRTPRPSTIPGDSDIWSDVWRSDDLGETWSQILQDGDDGSWSGRAYFQTVIKGGEMFVIGGQDYGLFENPYCDLLAQGLKPPPGLGIDPDAPCPEFLPTSEFFNDVWRSPDGIAWTEATPAAPWAGRAGLSAVVLDDYIYVLGGSTNDDAAIIGPNGPSRIYFNDVWKSSNGADWELVTEEAPWEPRAGASVVAFQDEIWLFGGEDGFTCSPLPDCEPPYFNDVWKSIDGGEWTLVNASAAWSPRPGHQCEVVGTQVACFGGFGLVENPTDLWYTSDGVEWTLDDETPWNAEDPTNIKYDFDSITVDADGADVIMTFGGDRETFDFEDPDNHLRVDSDVWSFGP